MLGIIDQFTRTALQQQQWTIVINEASPVPPRASLIELWKMYANGVAVTLSIQEEAGQFVLHTDVGHAMTGSNRVESVRFSTGDATVQRLVQECQQWDRTWET